MIRLLQEQDIPDSIRLLNYSFEYFRNITLREGNIVDRRIQDAIEERRLFGCVENGVLLSQAMYYDYKICVDGCKLPMAGIAIVSATPEARFKGKTGQLLQFMLDNLNEKMIPVSVLAPFSYAYYRKFGYEYCYRKKEIRLNINKFENFLHPDDVFLPVKPADYPVLNEIYEAWIGRYNGYVVRNGKIWQENTLCSLYMTLDRPYAYVHYDADGQAQGYLLYRLEGTTLTVHELAYRSYASLKSMLGFIYSHKSQCKEVIIRCPADFDLEFLVENPRFEQRLECGMSARVVNLDRAMGLRTFDFEGSLSIAVRDDNIAANNRCQEFVFRGGKCLLTVSEQPDVELTVNQFSQMYFGMCSPEEIVRRSQIACSPDTLAKLNAVFHKRSTYICNDF